MNRIFLRENTLYKVIANLGKNVYLTTRLFWIIIQLLNFKYRESYGGDG